MVVQYSSVTKSNYRPIRRVEVKLTANAAKLVYMYIIPKLVRVDPILVTILLSGVSDQHLNLAM